MIFIKQTFTLLLSLVLVLQISCVPISDYNEVFEYLQNFGYLSNDEKLSLNHIVDNHESVKHDNRLRRALKNLQRNGNIPITGKYDKNTANLMETPRCGVSDKNIIGKRHKRYTLMSTKWQNTDLTYRFDHKGNQRFMDNEEDIKRIIREAFNVWEKDTIMKFNEIEDEIADIMISFEKPKHTDVDPYIFGSSTLAHAFQPGRGIAGDAHFNELINWDFKVSYASKPEDGKVSFFGVVLHELGHSLGLGHTRVEEAVMYEFYSRSTSTLAEDDIRGMQHIYGVPPNRKYKPDSKPIDDEEEMPVWGQTPLLPHKCNSSYDAIAMIDDELIAFRKQYMFGPNMDTVEIRSRWRGLSPRLTHVDAVFETSDKKVLFFVNQGVYSFTGTKLEKTYKLSDLGIDSSALKIDAIFRKDDTNQVFIFVENYYYKFDEHKMMVSDAKYRISQTFRDVYDVDTGFTYKNGITYFFKNGSYYEFYNKLWRMNRMKPGSSASFFMNCIDASIGVDFAVRVSIDETEDISKESTTKILDYIDEGEKEDLTELDCNNPELAVPCEKDSANSIKSFSFIAAVLVVTHFFI